MGNNSCHLHRVPAGTPSHHITVERVQDNLMGELKRLIEVHKVLSLLDLEGITLFSSFGEFTTPDLDQCLKFVSSISEIADCVNIERILPLTHGVEFKVNFGLMNLLVDILAVLLNSCFKPLLLSLSGEWILRVQGTSSSLVVLKVVVLLLFIHQLVLNLLILLAREGKVVTLPLPVHVPLALVLIFVEDATGTDLLAHDSRWLKTVGQDDVRIHSGHVNVVDQGFGLIGRALLSDELELRNDLLLHLIIVCDLVLVHVVLDLKSEVHDLLDLVNYPLVARAFKAEFHGDVAAIDSGAKALHMATDIGFLIDEVTLVELFELILLLVGEDNVASEGLSH